MQNSQQIMHGVMSLQSVYQHITMFKAGRTSIRDDEKAVLQTQ